MRCADGWFGNTDHAVNDVVGDGIHDCVNLEPCIQRLVLGLVDAPHLLVWDAPEVVIRFAELPVQPGDVEPAHPIEHLALEVGATSLGGSQGVGVFGVAAFPRLGAVGAARAIVEASLLVAVPVLVGSPEPTAAKETGLAPVGAVMGRPEDNSRTPADHGSG